MKNFEAIGKTLWLAKEKTLVIADLHIGYEFMLLEKGFNFPIELYKKTKKEIEGVISMINKKYGKIEKIIILGDLKHEFGKINQEEWKNVLDILDFLSLNCKEVILIKGNHDNILGPLAEIKKVKIVDYLIIKEVCFFHGNNIWKEGLDKKVKIWILGHKHPAIRLSEGTKSELFKCFLSGRYKDKKIIILPSLFPLTEGSDVFMYDTHFAFKLDERNFEVFVIGKERGKEKIYRFGKVRNIQK